MQCKVGKLSLYKSFEFSNTSCSNLHEATYSYISIHLIFADKCVCLNLGGPEFCEGILQSRYTFSENDTQVINVTLCGVPAPILQWKFHHFPTKNATRNARNHYTYEYSIELPKLTQETCGRKLILNATGNKTERAELTVFLTRCKYENFSIRHLVAEYLKKWLYGRFAKFVVNKCLTHLQWHFIKGLVKSVIQLLVFPNNSSFFSGQRNDLPFLRHLYFEAYDGFFSFAIYEVNLLLL